MTKTNFKTMTAIFAVATIAVFAASCKKDFFPGDPEHMPIIGVERTITATAAMPQSGDKAYLDYADGRKVKWELTDAININGTNLPLALLYDDPTKAKFEGTTYAISSGSEDIYWAVYPAALAGASNGSSIHNDYTASTLTINFPSTHTYNSSANVLSGNTLMAGYIRVPANDDRIQFQMRNLGCVLKLNLKADASATNKLASRIVVSTTDGALAGKFTVSNATNPTITPAATATQTLTVNLTDGIHNYIDISSGADVYIILPPMASKNLTLGIYNTDNKCTMKTVSSITLMRNKIYTNTIDDVCFCCPDGFSVSATRRVVFAPGNLQWSAKNGGNTSTRHAVAGNGTAAGTWRFATNQWDCIGNNPGNNTAPANRSTQSYWIDLFGWGTSGYNNKFPYTGTDDSTDYVQGNNDIAGTYYDWGVYNAIYNTKTNRTDPAGTWRTPTNDEWVYVINQRATCSGVRYAMATVANVKGLIIVPDNWDVNTYVLNGVNSAGANFTANTISATVWTNTFEAAGCVFLPAAGNRTVQMGVDKVGVYGNYWSSTACNGKASYLLSFNSSAVYPSAGGGFGRHYGRSVRLVKDL